jgi:hypothetical protein
MTPASAAVAVAADGDSTAELPRAVPFIIQSTAQARR